MRGGEWDRTAAFAVGWGRRRRRATVVRRARLPCARVRRGRGWEGREGGCTVHGVLTAACLTGAATPMWAPQWSIGHPPAVRRNGRTCGDGSCGRSKKGAVGWNQCGWCVTPNGRSESSQRGKEPRSRIRRTIKKKRRAGQGGRKNGRLYGRQDRSGKGKNSGVQEKEREARWTGGAGAAAKRAATTTRVGKDRKKRKDHSGGGEGHGGGH